SIDTQPLSAPTPANRRRFKLQDKGGDWICMFCEYRLYYGDGKRVRKKNKGGNGRVNVDERGGGNGNSSGNSNSNGNSNTSGNSSSSLIGAGSSAKDNGNNNSVNIRNNGRNAL